MTEVEKLCAEFAIEQWLSSWDENTPAWKVFQGLMDAEGSGDYGALVAAFEHYDILIWSLAENDPLDAVAGMISDTYEAVIQLLEKATELQHGIVP